MIKAIVGANWGDEGKGKITDVLAAEADIVVRYQGGSNAGHTVIVGDKKYTLHQLPSGILYDHITNVVANGIALNPEYLMKEIELVSNSGVKPNLLISDRTQLLMPYHVLLDEYEEDRLGDKKFGSTKSGIAPFYADKYSKTGIQVWELYYDEPRLKEKIQNICEKQSIIFQHLYKKEPVQWEAIYERCKQYAKYLEPYVTDTVAFLRKAIAKNKNILLEGQLGALKDTDHGIYPYVTSSHTLAGNACVAAGIPPYELTNIIAVTKAYSSAVGEGPFVSEIFDKDAEELRRRGGDAGEYGVTTGRPRRVGYFDTVATRHGCMLQAATELVMTGLDVLGYLDKIPVCVGYELDGKVINNFPVTPLLYRAKPVYEYLPGWDVVNLRGVRSFSALPENARKYVRFIEHEIGIKISMVSIGPKRDEIIILD